MDGRAIGAALVSGLAAFVAVGAAVTEAALAWIEFSLFVGLPVGALAGVVTAVGVYLGLARDAPNRRRTIAIATGAFGAVFLGVLLLAAVAADLGVATSLAVGGVLGAVAAAGAVISRQ
jgi:hypothetical protein